MDDDETEGTVHGEGCTCSVDPLPGPRIRLDVHTPDPETAARIVEQLSRQAVGYAAEGMIASLIIIPNAIEIEVDTEIWRG